VSSEYRPRNDSEPSGLATANRVTVTAYALGEESFVDANGNNVFDQGESWDDLGDIFVDNNEDRIWVLGEQSVQYSANNTSACPDALPANGKLDNATSRPGTCDAVWGQAHVRRSMVIVLSGNTAQTDKTTLPMSLNCSKSFKIRLFDLFGNPMAAGTTLSLSNIDVRDSFSTVSTDPAVCGGFSPVQCNVPAPQTVTVTIEPTTVPNTNAAGGTFHLIQVTGPPPPAVCSAPVSGTFNLKVTTPISATTTIIPFTVLGDK
jgi:hypothetical protein